MKKTNVATRFLSWILLIVIIIGLFTIYDAVIIKNADSDSFFPIQCITQLCAAILGAVGMVVLSAAKSEQLRKSAFLIYFIGLCSLVSLLIIGKATNGATSWFNLGFIKIQPSEFMKPILIIYLASVFADGRVFERKRKWRHDLPYYFKPLIASLLVFLLVCAQKDFGTAAIILGIIFAMFYIGGAKKKVITFFVLLFFIFAGFSYINPPTSGFVGHIGSRIEAFKNPWAENVRLDAGFQTCHSLMALGCGGLTGVGVCKGDIKRFIPEAHTDYIFTTIAEDVGFMGSLFVIILLFAIPLVGFGIAKSAQSNYMKYLAGGISSMFAIQMFVNLAVVTNTIPATGLTLPFISYGGSSLFASLLSVGLLYAAATKSKNVDIDGDIQENESDNNRWRNRRTYISRNQYRPGNYRRR